MSCTQAWRINWDCDGIPEREGGETSCQNSATSREEIETEDRRRARGGVIGVMMRICSDRNDTMHNKGVRAI